MPTLTVIPSSYRDVSNLTLNTIQGFPITNAYTNADSTSCAIIAFSATGAGSMYFHFDTSALPANVQIISVTARCKRAVDNTNNVTKTQCQLASGTTKKGRNNPFAWTTSGSTYQTDLDLNVGTWTRDELDDLRLYFGATGGNNYQRRLRFYGADVTITYEVTDAISFKENGAWVEASKAYKKVSGVWVEQTDLTSVFDASTNYVKGN